MSAPIVYEHLFSIQADSLTDSQRVEMEAAIQSIEIDSGKPKSPYPIRSLGDDFAILVNSDLWLIFRPENGEVHFLGMMSQSFIDLLKGTSSIEVNPASAKSPPKKSASKRKPKSQRKPEPSA